MHSSPSTLSGLYVHGIQGLDTDHELWGNSNIHVTHPVRTQAPTYQRKGIDNPGWNEILDFYRRHIDDNGRPSVIIGHSFGARIAMQLLCEGYGDAGVLITPATNKPENISGYDWLVDIKKQYKEQLREVVAMDTLDEMERKRLFAEFGVLSRAPNPLDQFAQLTNKKIPLLHFQVQDDPWQIDGIPKIPQMVTHDLNTRSHWPQLSSVAQEMREVYETFLRDAFSTTVQELFLPESDVGAITFHQLAFA